MLLSAPLSPLSHRGRKQLDTSSDKASETAEIYSVDMSGHRVWNSTHLITAVCALLLQHAPHHGKNLPFYHSAHLVTAAPASVLRVSSFQLQTAPVLLEYNPHQHKPSLATAPLTHAKGIQLTYINHPSCIKLCYYQVLQIQNKSLQLSCLLQHPGSLSFNVFLPARCWCICSGDGSISWTSCLGAKIKSGLFFPELEMLQ